VTGNDPGLPDGIHRSEIAKIGKKNLRTQNARLVAAGSREQGIDGVEYLLRLARYALAGVFSDGSWESLVVEMSRKACRRHIRR
jgi:hypothetical protein